MITCTDSSYGPRGIAKWLKEEGIVESQVINIETLPDGIYRVWYRS